MERGPCVLYGPSAGIMKKLLFLCVAVCWPALLAAAPWGGILDYDVPQSETSVSADKVGERYLLAPILKGKSIRVALYLDYNSEFRRQDYEDSLRANYQQWFSWPAQLIRKQGREKEFADVLPILDKGVSLQFVPMGEEADIEVFVYPLAQARLACDGAYGCYLPIAYLDGKTPRIILPQENGWERFLSLGKVQTKYIGLHEVGHSLGLSDQYKQARVLNTHPIFSQEQNEKSVMAMATELSCDDADGIINLIDWTRGRSRGGQNGWRGLCAGSQVYYVNGRAAGKGPYSISSQDMAFSWRLDIYQPGEKPQSRILTMDLQNGRYPWEPLTETILQKDSSGRPVLARGQNGEYIYYSYIYDKKTRLITYKNRVVRAEISSLMYSKENRNEAREHIFNFFGENGKVSLVTYNRQVGRKDKKGTLWYANGWNEDNPALDIKLEFGGKGNVVSREVNWDRENEFVWPGLQDNKLSSLTPLLPFQQQLFPKQKQINKKGSNKIADLYASIRRQQLLRQKEEELKAWYLAQP